jgi:hypothetical protein
MNYIRAVQALVDAEVDFVIIGGWSAVLHGSAYQTNDLDICFSRASANLERLARALSPFHPRLRDLPRDLPFVWDEHTLANGTVFTLITDLGAVDLLAEVAGIGGFEDVKRRSVRAKAFGREIWTLDLPALIQSKRASGRAKDLLVIPQLESLLEARESDPE